MTGITDRARAVEQSSIRAMFDMAEASDRDLVRLEVGEPDFDTPDHIVDAAHDAARTGRTHYTSNAGLPELREAIGDTMREEFDVRVDPDDVVVTNGGMEALHLAVLATVDSGEELLLPTPTWPNYRAQAQLADGVPVEVPMPAAEGYPLDAARVRDAMTEDTAAVVLCTPSNPTGRVYDEDAIREVVAAAAERDACVIADEVYAGLSYDRDITGIAALTDHPDHVLTVNSCSKSYAMTGWRLGWLAGPSEVTDEVTKMHESTTACASSVAQHAALAALTGPQEPIEEMYETFRERRDYVVDRVEAIDGLSCPRPEGAFYAFLDPDVEASSIDVAKELLTDYGVVLAPGDGFGEAGEGQLRLSFANDMDRLETGFDRIERFFDDR